ncbi:hypothetical protein FA15DRAFT_662110 [Coprinopsis marcescibilis]|uniref:Uncharacterized protein n=1 Tax=Coprinopsis marcescibilis TaxID=230819 RepID=A0A5C3K974_COPMA|nr:hypothetical protein FA15DRAFT_662110 [Coprinopsis marcescibilis]
MSSSEAEIQEQVTPLDREHIDAILAHRSASPVVSGREVYTRHMMRDYGLPMWSPRPNSLPIDRRDKGVMPGDVGVLTDDGGGFCYLFNIWDDQEALKNLDVPGTREYRPPPPKELQDPTPLLTEMGSIITGADEVSTNHTDTSPCYSDLNYTWRDREGAILVTPFGAHAESLKDRSSIEPFIKHNCARLYQVARNRGIHTAPLYIVTGCVKSASWATASYSSKSPQPTVARLQNLPCGGVPRPGEQTFAYRWTSKPSGTDAHTGPKTLSTPLDDRNQNLFINGYRLNALLEEEAGSSMDLGSAAARTEEESGNAPSGNNLQRQNQAHILSPGSTSSSHVTFGVPDGKGSRQSYTLYPFPQRGFVSFNPGECINNYICSPSTMESIYTFAQNTRFKWRIGGALGRQTLRFSLLHDDIWLPTWHTLKPRHRASNTPANWENIFMDCMWRVRMQTVVVGDDNFDGSLFATLGWIDSALTTEQDIISIERNLNRATPASSESSIPPLSGKFEIEWDTLISEHSAFKHGAILERRPSVHVFPLGILVVARSCPTVAIGVLKELESRQLPPDALLGSVSKDPTLRRILNSEEYHERQGWKEPGPSYSSSSQANSTNKCNSVPAISYFNWCYNPVVRSLMGGEYRTATANDVVQTQTQTLTSFSDGLKDRKIAKAQPRPLPNPLGIKQEHIDTESEPIDIKSKDIDTESKDIAQPTPGTEKRGSIKTRPMVINFPLDGLFDIEPPPGYTSEEDVEFKLGDWAWVGAVFPWHLFFFTILGLLTIRNA